MIGACHTTIINCTCISNYCYTTFILWKIIINIYCIFNYFIAFYWRYLITSKSRGNCPFVYYIYTIFLNINNYFFSYSTGKKSFDSVAFVFFLGNTISVLLLFLIWVEIFFVEFIGLSLFFINLNLIIIIKF